MNGKECKEGIEFVKDIRVLDREIRISLYDTGEGINILIEGGDKGHIGAVAVSGPSMETAVITFPGHREDVVVKQWVKEISRVYHGPVVVSAGVHYDNIGKQEIQEILDALNRELSAVISMIEKRIRQGEK